MSFNLERFISAQENVYERVKKELQVGDKSTHWMWYIFPQIKGLGYSSTANYYAISSLDEAKAYLEHPILGSRLIECCQIILDLNGKTASEIFGYTDALKLKSSMTLFTLASSNAVFKKVLERYYNGEEDSRTKEIVNGDKP